VRLAQRPRRREGAVGVDHELDLVADRLAGHAEAVGIARRLAPHLEVYRRHARLGPATELVGQRTV